MLVHAECQGFTRCLTQVAEDGRKLPPQGSGIQSVIFKDVDLFVESVYGVEYHFNGGDLLLRGHKLSRHRGSDEVAAETAELKFDLPGVGIDFANYADLSAEVSFGDDGGEAGPFVVECLRVSGEVKLYGVGRDVKEK